MARLLLIQHLPTTCPGLVGAWLARQCHEAVVCRPLMGDELPPADGFDGIVLFGGPQSANDRCPRMARELHWVERALAGQHRLFGICLGGQLMAKALGARVAPDPDGQVECGFRWVDPGTDARWIPTERLVYHWHREGFDLPAQAQSIAQGRGAFPHQGFSYGRSLGVQFHPEATRAIMEKWMARDACDLMRPGAQAPAAQRSDYAHYEATHGPWLDATLNRWLSAALPAVKP